MRMPFISLFFLICFSFFCSANSWNFNETLAEQYLYYSYATYCNTDDIASWDCKWCEEPSVREFTPTAFPYDRRVSGYGFVGVHAPNRTIVVSFRGSDDLKNFIIDAESAFLTQYKNMTDLKVGDGFYKEWTDLMPQVIPAVESLVDEYPGFEIWVTGHSLGAAISILCALELVEEGFQNVNVYNYGLPRVGNEDFATYFNSMVPNTYRVVNGHDIVPSVPYQWMGFYHVATEVWESPAGLCDGSGEDPNCSDADRGNFSVSDHLHYLGIFESCN